MKHLLILLLLVTFGHSSQAAIQVQSFYFQKKSTELTSKSRQKLQAFMSTLGDSSIQILELSCYAEGSTPDSSKWLSDQRMTGIIDFLGLKNKPITINSWGSKRINVRFTPENWDRIDIYCQVEGLSPALDYSKLEQPSLPDPPETSIEEPLIINVLFEGGTSVIIEETMSSLHSLYDALKENTDLTAHIRGHVCCENNKRLSRTRAKEVYDFLVEKGISMDRLSYRGYGNKVPLISPERDAEDRRLNRRVDVIFGAVK